MFRQKRFNSWEETYFGSHNMREIALDLYITLATVEEIQTSQSYHVFVCMLLPRNNIFKVPPSNVAFGCDVEKTF